MKNGKFLFLGTGASLGIPVVGCECSVCRCDCLKNKRLRPSALVTLDQKKILIDAGPDFRHQALTYKIHALDVVLLTHLHYDHVAGLDDMRIFYYIQNKPMYSVLSKDTLENLKYRYNYFFENKFQHFQLHILEGDFGVTDIFGIEVEYFSFYQQKVKVTGYKIGNLAYVTDIRSYTDELLSVLDGIENLVVSGLRNQPTSAHFSIEQAIDFSQKIRAKKTWITHIAHDVDHREVSLQLPPKVKLAYDGLEIGFKY